ncbi:alkaline phosphatase [Parabacteroides sp. FAFU027]|uniref:alkaline phosphatase n=1 Tax=Parabacteroides sp. FAFU027 TaxID=2922715 RepID=UPI001FAFB890|nr:alkaline phosphatase [Parabacteroides sp. FAFU027]
MTNTLKTGMLLVACLFVVNTTDSFAQKVRNIIVMIGDGMGFNQVQAALTVTGNNLNMAKFPYTGIEKTYSANNYITDSAAGGTAIACGVKTNNGMIGVTPDTVPVQSILSVAEKNGLSTGIVVTCNLTHATPATFYAHAGSRNSTQEIASWFPKSGVDVAIGGGINDFEKRTDGRNLSNELKQAGYTVAYSMEEAAKAPVKSPLLTFLAEDHPKKASEGRDYLPEAVELAMKRLSNNKKGFFLMVEGSQIDWGGHANDGNYVVTETVDFDNAVGKVLEFAKRDGHTLVIITADHETGGTAIREGSFKDKTVKIDFTKTYHTGAPVPIFAYGPGAEQFTGWLENTNYKNKIEKLAGLKE